MTATVPVERNANELLYQADERPPLGLTVGLGAQLALLAVSSSVFHATIVHRAAGSTDEVIAWAVFVCLIVTAGITALQAVRIGRFGGGYVLVTGTVAAAIAVSSDAIKAGGTELLAALLIASALFQFVFASRIAMFRRILTPSVSGTILILMAVSLVPIASDRITDLPPGHQPVEGFICMIVTLGIIVLIVLKGGRRLSPWAAIFGLGGGAAVASLYGLYDVELVKNAAWIGVPRAANVVLVPDFGPSFWVLLPAFLLVSMACAIRAMGTALAVQDVSWRVPRAADFRTVQGAVTRDSLANLIAGIGGGIFMSTRSQTIAFIQITHVSARWVGLSFGAVFAAIAFVPKVIALILALPAAVFAGYVFVMIAVLFVAGIKMVVSNGLDHRQGLIVGLSFCAAVGCEYGLIAPEPISEIAGGVFENGLIVGGMMAILLTTILELTGGRRHRLETELDVSSLRTIQDFVTQVASEQGWTKKTVATLEAIAEETLVTLVEEEENAPRRRLRISVQREGNTAVLEFIARPSESNIEDRIAMLSDAPSGHGMDRDISLRLLRHLASEVRHRQYRDTDFITARVNNAKDDSVLNQR